MSARGRGALVALALAAVTSAVFWRLPLEGRAYLPADLLAETAPWRDTSVVPRNPASQDPIRQYYPASARLAARGAFRWETALGLGEPLSIQPTFEGDSPVARVAYAVLPPWAASGAIAALHLFLAGAGMTSWARARGSRRESALVAGIGYALAPWAMGWLEAQTIVVAWAALPWALACLERASRERSLGHIGGAALAFGLGALGGHLQVVELGLLAAGALALVTPAAGRRRSLATTGVAALLGLLIAAARLVPALVELAAAGRGRIPLERYLATTGSLDFRRSLLLLFPDLLGDPVPSRFLSEVALSTSWIERGRDEVQANFLELRPHAGTVVLLLALVGARRPGSRRLLALAALAFVLALGTPLAAVPWAVVPGFGATTPLRFLALVPLFLGPLVAQGLDLLAEDSATGRRRALSPVLAATGVLVTVALVLASPLGPGLVAPAHAAGDLGRRALAAWLSPTGRALGRPVVFALATLAGVLGSVLAGSPTRRLLARAVVAGLLAFDLLEGGVRLQTTCEPAALYPETPAIRAVARLTGPDARALLEHDVPLDALLASGIPTVGSYASAHVARTRDLLEALGALDRPHGLQWLRPSARLSPDWQRFLGVAVILAPPGATAPAPDVALVYSGEATVFARTGASRAWLFPGSAATFVPDERGALDVCSRPGFSPLESLVLESATTPSPGATPAPSGPSPRARPIAVLEPDPEHVRVIVTALEPSVLVLSDSFAPGVGAKLDGHEARILPAFAAFRGVLVPPGEHEIVFEFTPPGWPWAPVVSWASGLACVALLLARRRDGASRG